MNERATPHPFTQEDAAAWAQVCYRLSIRWGEPVTDQILHLTMDVNWTDALAMWVFSRERLLILRYNLLHRRQGMRALNEARAFGLAEPRARYSDQLYRMLNDERRMQQ
jgi:hypothetical protein